jgi:8-oxo-dGTP pyrophosphatase MutT (NUDIX family)
VTNPSLLELLTQFPVNTEHDRSSKEKMITFHTKERDCFKRSLLKGHFTGSAWIIDPTHTQTLLTHHMKLDIWVQLGGHADGNSDLIAVATTEAHEESGLKSIQLLSPTIFDLDIHEIPEHKGIPAHLHYDIRFLFQADPAAPLIENHETRELKWIPISEVSIYNKEEALLRMAKRTPA